MVCTGPSLTVESYEAVSSALKIENEKPCYRRRHSSFHPRRKSSSAESMDGEEGLLLRVRIVPSWMFPF
jgi:adiponectin receptor